MSFSLFAGGPLYQIAVRLGLVRGESTLPRLGVALALLTWIPLLVFSALAGVSGLTSGGVAVPFVLGLGAHVRFLVAIPLFFAAEAWTGPRLGHFFEYLVESGIVLPEDRPSLDAAAAGATRLRDSVIAEAGLAVLSIIALVAGVRVDLTEDVSSWRTIAGVPTWAGVWYAAVSLPIFQFLWWRWCWRVVIWTILLWRVSRLNLRLVATHPDLAGGLGYLGVAQGHFGTLALPLSAVLSASFAEQILFDGRQLRAFLPLIVGHVFMTLVTFLGPLLVFTPRLLKVKRRGLREYGVVAAAYTHLFEAKWVRGREAAGEPLLGSADIQSLADLANSFNIVRYMRLAPFGPALVIALVASAIVPMAPLLFLQFSPEELLRELVKVLLGG